MQGIDFGLQEEKVQLQILFLKWRISYENCNKWGDGEPNHVLDSEFRYG